jgi:hypothetical protein
MTAALQRNMANLFSRLCGDAGRITPATWSTTFRPGRAGRTKESLPVLARVVNIDDVFVTVAFSESVERRYRNHELDRLWAAIGLYGDRVLVQERWNLLRVRADEN